MTAENIDTAEETQVDDLDSGEEDEADSEAENDIAAEQPGNGNKPVTIPDLLDQMQDLAKKNRQGIKYTAMRMDNKKFLRPIIWHQLEWGILSSR